MFSMAGLISVAAEDGVRIGQYPLLGTGQDPTEFLELFYVHG